MKNGKDIWFVGSRPWSSLPFAERLKVARYDGVQWWVEAGRKDVKLGDDLRDPKFVDTAHDSRRRISRERG